MTSRTTVLTLRALGLGDLLTAVPALRAIRRAHPDARHLLACPRPLARLALATGAIDGVVPTSGLGEQHHAVPAQVALAVNLHGRGPESHALLLRLRPGRLVAFAHPAVEVDGAPPWWEDEHEVRRWCRLVEAFGMAADAADLTVDPREPFAVGFSGATLLHPGAAAAARRWPPDRWVRLAVALSATGHRVVLTGDRAERGQCEDIAEKAGIPEAAALVGHTEPLDLLALAHRARCVVSGDTGMAHVATAVGTPSVVLFGPTSPRRWGPPDRPQHRTIWKGPEGDPLGTDPDPALLHITVDEVLAHVECLPPNPQSLRPLHTGVAHR